MMHDDISALKKMLEQDVIILDVRTVQEFEEGHIEGSRNIPLHTLPAFTPEFKEGKKAVIACCRSGARSNEAAKFLNQNGIEALNGGPWELLESLMD